MSTLGGVEVVFNPWLPKEGAVIVQGVLNLGRAPHSRLHRLQVSRPRRRRVTFTPKAFAGSRGWNERRFLMRLFR